MPDLALMSMVVMASLAVARRSESQTTPEAVRPAELKAYVESIPGTDLKFDMLPIPGGTFVMGSPPDEPNRSPDEGPAHRVADRAVLDGQARGDLGRVRPVRLLV